MVIGNKQKILLGLVLFLAALLTYRAFNPYRQKTVSKLTYGRTTKIKPLAPKDAYDADARRPTKVMTTLFEQPPRLVVDMHRDPFRKALKSISGQASKPVDPQPQPPPIERSALDRAKEQLGRFKVFGSFRQGERTSLFLERGKQVLVISAGDRIDGKFKIESIDGRTVVISTAEIAAPFEFGFEELQATDAGGSARTSLPAATPVSARRPAFREPPESPPESSPPESSEGISPESDEEIPPLPVPPPLETPANPPPSLMESPSRGFLPGNKPPE